MTTGITLKSSDFETCQTTSSSSNLFYRKSTVDLIVNFFKTYKHIKRITLFLCDNRSDAQSSIRVPFDYHQSMISSAIVEQQNHEHHHANDCLNYQQIVKYLMASGNFLIKGDGNLDATMFNTSAVGNVCNRDIELGSDSTYRLWDMLKSGDFKQGVIIDLRCRHSRFILQQVNKITSRYTCTLSHYPFIINKCF